MMRISILLGTGVLWVMVLSVVPSRLAEAASQTKAHLDVYPLNCTFEYVNDGSNQIIYLTPKECGQTPLSLSPLIQPADPAFEIIRPADEHQIILPESPPLSDDPGAGNKRLADPPKLVVQDISGSTITMWASLVTGAAIGVGLVMDFFISEFAVSKAAVGWAGSRALGFGRFVRRLITFTLKPPF